MMLALGLAVTSSFKTFLLAQPMPAAKPVKSRSFHDHLHELVVGHGYTMKIFFQMQILHKGFSFFSSPYTMKPSFVKIP